MKKNAQKTLDTRNAQRKQEFLGRINVLFHALFGNYDLPTNYQQTNRPTNQMDIRAHRVVTIRRDEFLNVSNKIL